MLYFLNEEIAGRDREKFRGNFFKDFFLTLLSFLNEGL